MGKKHSRYMERPKPGVRIGFRGDWLRCPPHQKGSHCIHENEKKRVRDPNTYTCCKCLSPIQLVIQFKPPAKPKLTRLERLRKLVRRAIDAPNNKFFRLYRKWCRIKGAKRCKRTLKKFKMRVEFASRVVLS